MKCRRKLNMDFLFLNEIQKHNFSKWWKFLLSKRACLDTQELKAFWSLSSWKLLFLFGFHLKRCMFFVSRFIGRMVLTAISSSNAPSWKPICKETQVMLQIHVLHPYSSLRQVLWPLPEWRLYKWATVSAFNHLVLAPFSWAVSFWAHRKCSHFSFLGVVLSVQSPIAFDLVFDLAIFVHQGEDFLHVASIWRVPPTRRPSNWRSNQDSGLPNLRQDCGCRLLILLVKCNLFLSKFHELVVPPNLCGLFGMRYPSSVCPKYYRLDIFSMPIK